MYDQSVPTTTLEPAAWVSYKYKDAEVGSQYDNQEASVMLAVAPDGRLLAAPEAIAQALSQASALVRDQLTANGVPAAPSGVAAVQQAFPGASVVEPTPAAPPVAPAAPQPAPAPAAPAAPAADGIPRCPKCGSEMFDNRHKKLPKEQGGEGWNPKGPDFTCRRKRDGCDGVIWPPRG